MEKGFYGKIVSTNLKVNFPSACLSAAGIFVLTMLLFNITALQGRDAARPIEFLLSWVGVMLLAPIFLPEQNKDIRDVICSKKIDYIKVCGIRVLYSAVKIVLLVTLFVGIMKLRESDVDGIYLFGGIATAMFLGAVSFAAAGLSGNATVGYMAGMLYYIANYGLKDKLGKFYLFSMSAGNFDNKEWLLAGALVLIIVTFVIMKVRQKW